MALFRRGKVGLVRLGVIASRSLAGVMEIAQFVQLGSIARSSSGLDGFKLRLGRGKGGVHRRVRILGCHTPCGEHD